MRRSTLIVSFTLLIHLVYGQGISLLWQRDSALKLQFKSSAVELKNDGYFVHISSAGAQLLHALMQPDLPVWSCPLALPEGAMISDSIISADTVYLQLPIVPGRGLSKGSTFEEYTLGKPYRSNAVFPITTASLSTQYQLYNLRGQNLHYIPFRYYPQSGMLVIIRESNISITAPHSIPVYLPETQYFVNTKQTQRNKLRSAAVAKPSMLILCPDDFIPQVQKFMRWKMHQGTICYLEPVLPGTSPEIIKEIVSRNYSKHSISYVLIIGDSEQIPPMQRTGDSDAAYGFLVGEDAYAEAAVGRISASIPAEAELQLARIEQYEQHRFAPRVNTYIMAASGEGPGDDGEYDYEHLRTIKSRLDAAGFFPGSELYDGDRGGNDAVGDPSAVDLANEINKGADLMFYIGHGEAMDLRTTHMQVADTALLSNTQWPFAMIGGCQVGNFVGQTCLAEAMLRTGSAGEAKGFAAVLASSNDQLWAPPMRAQDAFADAFLQNGDLRLGALLQKSMRDMITVYGDDGSATASTWNLFGDPSMVLHTKLVDSIIAQIPAELSAGTVQLTFDSDRAGAYFALSRNDILVAEGSTVAGENIISTNPLLPGEYLFTIFAPNTVCYMQTVQVGLSPEMLVAVESVKTSSDISGLSIDCSHTVAVGGMVANISTMNVADAEIFLETSSPAIKILAVHNTLPAMASGMSVWQDSIALLSCVEVAPDYSFPYTVTITSGQMTNVYRGTMSAKIPQYAVTSVTILPTAGSNSNTTVEAGEVVDVSLVLTNSSTIQSSPDWLKMSSSDNIALYNLTYKLKADSILVQARMSISTLSRLGEPFALQVSYGNTLFTAQSQYRGKLKQICETWDMGAPILPWKQSEIAPWFAEQDVFRSTVMRSGTIGADGKSRMELVYTSASDDTIRFDAKVSCELPVNFGSYTDYYDYLEFSIDSITQIKLAGEIDWHEYRFPVSAGKHVFAWEYAKDYDSDGGQDAAWLDSIVMPPAAESFSDPLIFTLPDTIILYPNDVMDYNIEFPFTADTVILFEAPSWLGVKHSAQTWQLSGAAGDLGTANVLVSCNSGSQYSHAKFVLQVIPRPIPILSFTAEADGEIVASGDSITVSIQILNSGNADSKPGWVRLSAVHELLVGLDSVYVPEVPPSGNFTANVRFGARACLPRDTSDVITATFFHVEETFKAEQAIMITGVNVAVTAIGFQSGVVNNGDSIVQTGEQLQVYASAKNNSGKAVAVSVVVATELGNWQAESELLPFNDFVLTGDEIVIPQLWSQNSLTANISLSIGGCKYMAKRQFAAQQTSVAGYDTLWLTHTQGERYELCLPDNFRFELFDASTDLTRTANCLTATLLDKKDTVLLGNVNLMSGTMTGIAPVVAIVTDVAKRETSLLRSHRWWVHDGMLSIWCESTTSTILLANVTGTEVFSGITDGGHTLIINGLSRGTYIAMAMDGGRFESFIVVVD